MRKKSSIPGKINDSKIKGQGARTEGNILSENLMLLLHPCTSGFKFTPGFGHKVENDYKVSWC